MIVNKRKLYICNTLHTKKQDRFATRPYAANISYLPVLIGRFRTPVWHVNASTVPILWSRM